MTNKMEVNKEVALRLWNAQFGKADKATDFAGREMAKAAYNNRNSRFCWNVDHIYPQTLGGKTVDSNLICCHMLTNDEKADNYPAFTANGKKFIIKKVQNHYEIVEIKDKNGESKKDEKKDDSVNFFDAAAGLEFFKQCGEPYWVGLVKIVVDLKYGNRKKIIGELYSFLRKIFGCPAATDSDLICEETSDGCEFKLFDFKVAKQEYVQNMLDNCVLINTYFQYFKRKSTIQEYEIFCGLKKYDNLFFAKKAKESDYNVRYLNNEITIDNLVKINTSANDKNLEEVYGYYKYAYIFTELNKSLNKQ